MPDSCVTPVCTQQPRLKPIFSALAELTLCAPALRCSVDFYRDASAADECLECIVGAQCAAKNLSLATIVVDERHWRLTARSNSLQKCDTVDSCPGGVGGGDALCALGHTGPLCRVCLEPGYYYDKDTAACAVCPTGSSKTGSVLLALAGLLVASPCVAAAVRRYYRNRPVPQVVISSQLLWRRFRAMCSTLGFTGYFKIILSFYRAVATARTRDLHPCRAPQH